MLRRLLSLSAIATTQLTAAHLQAEISAARHTRAKLPHAPEHRSTPRTTSRNRRRDTGGRHELASRSLLRGARLAHVLAREHNVEDRRGEHP